MQGRCYILSEKLSETTRWLQERKQVWEELKALVKRFTERAHTSLGAVTVWLYGSVARSDFNLWSDVDVLVVAEQLPDHPLRRQDLLMQVAPPKVEPIGYTRDEFERLLAKRHPNLIALLQEAICLRDDLGLMERVKFPLSRKG